MVKKYSKKEKVQYMYGKHALVEALTARPEAIKKVFLSANAKGDPTISKLLKKHKIVTAVLRNTEASGYVGRDAVHQGIIAVLDTDKLYTPLEEFTSTIKKEETSGIVVLDELSDPHNVGAIIRSAAAFGMLGIIIPEYRQAPLTAAVIKTSAGMVFRIPIIKVPNVNYTISMFKEQYFAKVYGLFMEGSSSLPKKRFTDVSIFVVGNESSGIREKTEKLCDERLSIPMDPRCESLNAATAASIVFYAWNTQKE